MLPIVELSLFFNLVCRSSFTIADVLFGKQHYYANVMNQDNFIQNDELILNDWTNIIMILQ